MNFLAHAVLSFDDKDILAGNFMGDFIKGKNILNQFPEPIKDGIILHRSIDFFTDTNPITQKASQPFREDYRLYSGAFIDIVYDHFLANDLSVFLTDEKLFGYTQSIYNALDENKKYFPESFERVFPYMKHQNWLYDYRLKEGVQRAFRGLVRRAKYMDDADTAYQIFLDNYDELHFRYRHFFTEVRDFAQKKLNTLKEG